MRSIPLLLALLLLGCQSSGRERDYSEKPKTCDSRSIESGLCVPGEYDY